MKCVTFSGTNRLFSSSLTRNRKRKFAPPSNWHRCIARLSFTARIFGTSVKREICRVFGFPLSTVNSGATKSRHGLPRREKSHTEIPKKIHPPPPTRQQKSITNILLTAAAEKYEKRQKRCAYFTHHLIITHTRGQREYTVEPFLKNLRQKLSPTG